jgi:hypothetical protein
MPAEAFSRETFLAARDFAERLTQADITRLFQRIGYVDRQPDESKSKRLSRFLNEGPLRADKWGYDGETRDRAFVLEVATDFGRLASWEIHPEDDESKKGVYERFSLAFLTALEADGYVLLEDGTLAPAGLALGDPQPPSEAIERMLQRFGFGEAANHRRQALDAYRGGNWASANAQVRTFLLSLLRALYGNLVGGVALDDKAARDSLAGLDPPFLRPDVKEWDPQAKGSFLHGVFSRLAEDGSHPGLSSRAEAKFRLRLADAIALDWLERLESLSN